MPSSDHREKAVEAATQAFELVPVGAQFRERLKQLPEYGETVVPPSELASGMIAAAEPHLRRAHFEEFREAVLSDEALEADAKKRWLEINGAAVEQSRIGIEAALDKAQELLEDDHA